MQQCLHPLLRRVLSWGIPLPTHFSGRNLSQPSRRSLSLMPRCVWRTGQISKQLGALAGAPHTTDSLQGRSSCRNMGANRRSHRVSKFTSWLYISADCRRSGLQEFYRQEALIVQEYIESDQGHCRGPWCARRGSLLRPSGSERIIGVL